MSSHNEQVNPAPFDAAAPSPAPGQHVEAKSATPRWVIPALLGLLLVAVLVVFWLPGKIQPDIASSPATETIGADAGAPPSQASQKAAAPAQEKASPWSDAQLARLRKEAQDMLAQLLDLQLALEERSVAQWGAEQFAAAAELATAADELYRQRQFTEATSTYQQARDQMQALLDSVPSVVEQQLQAARGAIAGLDVEQANTHIALAQLIEPENGELPQLQHRAEQLPALVEHY
jgi:hypothetical protein